MIDKLDSKILAQLDANCRQSNTQIAKKVQASREVVAYRIKRLEEQGIIERYIASINPHAIGQQLFRIYVQLENKLQRRQQFLQELLASKYIYWVGEFDGAWDYVFVVTAKDQTTFYDWKNELFDRYSDVILKRATGMVVDVQQYSRKFLTGVQPKGVVWGGPVTRVATDAVDQKLLNVLSNNARMSTVDLAKVTNTSVDIVMRRMKHLEKQGVIVQYRIALDFKKLGLEFYKAFFSLRGLSKHNHARLSEYFLHNKQCAYYIRIIAGWECEPEFLVKDYHEFTDVINTIRQEFADIIRAVETSIIKKEWWLPGLKDEI